MCEGVITQVIWSLCQLTWGSGSAWFTLLPRPQGVVFVWVLTHSRASDSAVSCRPGEPLFYDSLQPVRGRRSAWLWVDLGQGGGVQLLWNR